MTTPPNFPTAPTVPLPTWATGSGATLADPGTVKRAQGWTTANPGVSYGEAPPFAWVNNEAYNNGQWATYFNNAINSLLSYQPTCVLTFQNPPSFNFTRNAGTRDAYALLGLTGGSVAETNPVLSYNPTTQTFIAAGTCLVTVSVTLIVSYRQANYNTPNAYFDWVSVGLVYGSSASPNTYID
jgi:hypothetical protein